MSTQLGYPSLVTLLAMEYVWVLPDTGKLRDDRAPVYSTKNWEKKKIYYFVKPNLIT